VIASNNDGVWNETGATADFTIPPAFFQTTWFRLLCVVAAMGILWLLYALRLRRMAASIRTRFAERLAERERIARDLHDTLLQGIFSAAIHFDVANNRLPADSPAKSAVQRGIELLKQVSEEGRNALRALRSPQSTEDSLEEALSRLQKEFALPENFDFQVVTQGEPRELRPLIRDEVYLIAREAVFNAFRHSKAHTIEVEVDYGSRNLRVLVRDDGCGIDPQVLKTGREGHWGLGNMRERAEKVGAKFEVLSRVDAGTEIQLWIPGKLAFEGNSTARGFWTRLSGLYSSRKEQNIDRSSEELKK
jgi:signal transduction histidine kinase